MFGVQRAMECGRSTFDAALDDFETRASELMLPVANFTRCVCDTSAGTDDLHCAKKTSQLMVANRWPVLVTAHNVFFDSHHETRLVRDSHVHFGTVTGRGV